MPSLSVACNCRATRCIGFLRNKPGRLTDATTICSVRRRNDALGHPGADILRNMLVRLASQAPSCPLVAGGHQYRWLARARGAASQGEVASKVILDNATACLATPVATLRHRMTAQPSWPPLGVTSRMTGKGRPVTTGHDHGPSGRPRPASNSHQRSECE
jgi:hypothetical protein